MQRINELQYADVVTDQSDVCYFVADICTALNEGKHSGTLVVDLSTCVMLPSGVCRDLMNQRRSFSYSGEQKPLLSFIH